MKAQSMQRKKHTGRRLVLLNADVKRETLFKTARNASVALAHFNDYVNKPEQYVQAFTEGDGIYFEELHVAVMNQQERGSKLHEKGARTKGDPDDRTGTVCI
jgi:hypothetical protein